MREMTADETLVRLLKLRGRNVRRALSGDVSLEEMLRGLDECAIDARLIRPGASELEFLEPPALLRRHDGRWFLLLDGPVDLSGVEGVLQLLPEPPREKSVWRRVGLLLIERPRVLAHIVIASLLLVLLALIPPQLTRLMIDGAISSGATSLLNLIAIGIVAVSAFQVWTSWLRAHAILYLKSRTDALMESELVSHVLNLPFAFLNGKTIGQLLQSFAGLAAARGMITDQALGAAADGVTTVLYLMVMFVMMPAPAAGVVVAALVSGMLALIAGRLQARLQRRETDAQSRQRDFLVELLTGVATVKASGTEAWGLAEWLDRLRSELSLRLRRQRVGIFVDAGQTLIGQSSNVMLLVWGAVLVLRGEASLGSLLAFLQISAGFLRSVLGLTGTYLSVRLLQSRMAELQEVLAVDPEPRPCRQRGRRLNGPVVFDDVWFRYRASGRWILQSFNMEVQPGEKRWIRGPSGAGKSTIFRLMAGLYAPERGTIRIAGRVPLAAREQLIYLPQLLQLYGGSILDNLKLFSGNAPRERLLEASAVSGLDRLIARMPLGLETIVPPGGMTLSGGERQLIAMTAVMASDRSLFLLDEALVSLDWISRASVEHNPWFDNKTVIYASHDGFRGNATFTSVDYEYAGQLAASPE